MYEMSDIVSQMFVAFFLIAYPALFIALVRGGTECRTQPRRQERDGAGLGAGNPPSPEPSFQDCRSFPEHVSTGLKSLWLTRST